MPSGARLAASLFAVALLLLVPDGLALAGGVTAGFGCSTFTGCGFSTGFSGCLTGSGLGSCFCGFTTFSGCLKSAGLSLRTTAATFGCSATLGFGSGFGSGLGSTLGSGLGCSTGGCGWSGSGCSKGAGAPSPNGLSSPVTEPKSTNAIASACSGSGDLKPFHDKAITPACNSVTKPITAGFKKGLSFIIVKL